MSKTVIILSGGLDSSTLAYSLKSQGHDLSAISFNYGQRHVRELHSAQMIAERLRISYKLIGIPALWNMLPGSSLTDEAVEVPYGHYASPTMKQTVVPGRNAMMISIAWAVAAANDCQFVAAAVHSGDHYIYPDCRPEFIAALNYALHRGVIGINDKLSIATPFLFWNKTDIVRYGRDLGVPFDKTWTCYEGYTHHCGECGACVERREAFREAGVDDPTVYRRVREA